MADTGFTVTVRTPLLPTRLTAREPGWFETTDVVVVGSGIAGLTTALHLREAGLHVTVVTKVNVDDGATRWAQGGIAAALDPSDSPAAHAEDTLAAGGGLCDPAMVELLTTEGPARVRELIRWGARFDQHPDGRLMLTREGGHRARRIAHAGGDATGATVQRALHAAVRRDPWIRLVEHAMALDLLVSARRAACGVTLHVLGEGSPDGVGAILARAVVLATGGMGQVYAATTNPVVSTGDGLALGLRAGAEVADLEFVQFHPTSLCLDPEAGGQLPLVTEALRGEGAYLVDAEGRRFMVGVHEMAELAPRDVVAKEVYRVARETGAGRVWLDARHLGRELLERRFPTLVGYCGQAGLDPARDPVPVAPAAHYVSGGLRTDRFGRTTVPGLYACGEVACTGVHGANRLASNSLLEALVFARRIADDIAADPPPQADPVGVPAAPAGPPSSEVERSDARPSDEEPDRARAALRRAVTAGAGVLRSEGSLVATVPALEQAVAAARGTGTRAWELANLATVATALVAAAAARTESRGCHWREDFPERDDRRWLGHLVGRLAPDGSFTLSWEQA